MKTLLDLRRREEETAEAAWNTARGLLAAAEAEAERRDDVVTSARARLTAARERAGSGGVERSSAAQATTETRFLARLRDEANRAAKARDTFYGGPLATARAEERRTETEHRGKRRAREAVEKHEARFAAERKREAERREEEARDEMGRATRPGPTRDPGR